MTDWLLAFLFTQLFEIPIYAYALAKYSWPRRLTLAFVPSALTHPIVWLVFPLLIPDPYWGMVAAAESFAILTEALVLLKFGVIHPFRYSFLANCFSLSIGLLCRSLFGVP